MKITQALVKKVKRLNKYELHNQAWRDFMTLPEVKSINMAIDRSDFDRQSLSEIVNTAKEFFKEFFPDVINVDAAQNLDQLLELLISASEVGQIAGMGWETYHGIDMASLPIFSDNEIVDPSEIWSYDDERMIIIGYSGTDFYITERNDIDIDDE